MSVAQPLPHDSAELHVTGRARYVDDVPVPQGTLHLAFGLSTVAHGEILSIIAVPGAAGSGEAFERLITEIVAVSAGQARSGHPIPEQGPKFAITAPHIDYEARASAPKGKRLGRKLAIVAQTCLGGAASRPS